MNTISHSIVHFDLDTFFVSVERLVNTELEGKPVIVAGDPDGRRNAVVRVRPAPVAPLVSAAGRFPDGHPRLLLSCAELERLRARLAHSPLVHEERGILVTFSAGVARWLPGESQDELLARADRAMYQAKQAGKNRVVAVER